MNAWWEPRCEEGDLAFVKSGPNAGRLVRVESREPSRDGWPMWWVTSMGSPLPVPQRDGSTAARRSAVICDCWLIPMRLTPDAPVPKPASRKRPAKAKGGTA